MKETANLIYNTNFNRIDRAQKRNTIIPVPFSLKNVLTSFKDELISGLATLGIGSIFLFSIYLFLTQLAEYGWQ